MDGSGVFSSPGCPRAAEANPMATRCVPHRAGGDRRGGRMHGQIIRGGREMRARQASYANTRFVTQHLTASLTHKRHSDGYARPPCQSSLTLRRTCVASTLAKHDRARTHAGHVLYVRYVSVGAGLALGIPSRNTCRSCPGRTRRDPPEVAVRH